MPQVLIQMYEDEPDNLTQVEWDENLEDMPGKNTELEFTVSSHYTILIKYYENTMGSSFFTIQSWGDGGVDASIAMSRRDCLLLARQTYGAPHCEEFEKLVDRLLISQEEMNRL